MLLMLAGAACSGQPGDAASASPAIPECAAAGAVVTLPDAFPDDFPLPAGTRITDVQETDDGVLLVGGVIPGSLSAAATFFSDEVPAAGFEAGEGDAEQDEAEASFWREGSEGSWKVHSILDCPTAVTLTVAIASD
jgi:hypothetical protein